MKYKRSQLNKLMVASPIHMLGEVRSLIAAATRAGDVEEDEPHRRVGEIEKEDSEYARGQLDMILAGSAYGSRLHGHAVLHDACSTPAPGETVRIGNQVARFEPPE